MQPFLVELEERLARDADGSVRAAIVGDLTAARAALADRLARGASPEQYRRWSAADRAIGAALSALAHIRIDAPGDKLDGPAVNFKGE